MPIFEARLQFERFLQKFAGLLLGEDVVRTKPCLGDSMAKLSEILPIFRGLTIRIVCRSAKEERSGEQTLENEKTVP